MVAFSQMKSVTTITFVLASTVSAMHGSQDRQGVPEDVEILEPQDPENSPGLIERFSQRARSLSDVKKRLAIATGVGVATGFTAGGMAYARGERNEMEAFPDLASAPSAASVEESPTPNPEDYREEGLREEPGEYNFEELNHNFEQLEDNFDLPGAAHVATEETPPKLDIHVMTRAEATEAGIEIPDTVPGAESIDGHIFYAQNDAFNQTRAELLQTELYGQGIFDNLEVNELAEGFNFGNHDLVIIREVDPTSIGQTWGMICLLGLGMLAILFTLLVVTDGNYGGKKQAAVYTGIALGVVAASISGGYGLHFLSADNIGGMIGCAIGFGFTVICLAFLINNTRQTPLHWGKVITHVIGGAALLGGCAMLTNLAGEAVGENMIDKIRQTIIDPTNPEAAPSMPSGMAEEAFISFGILAVGFLWFFYSFFQNIDNGKVKNRVIAISGCALGGLATSALVVGGSHLVALEQVGAGVGCFVAVPAIICGIFWILGHKRCGLAGNEEDM